MGLLKLVGRVVSNHEMQKTAKVCVTRLVMHPVTKKYIKNRKVFLAHDESDSRQNGDVVRIEECQPLSKRKHFKIIEVLKEVETFVDPATGKTLTKFTPASFIETKRGHHSN